MNYRFTTLFEREPDGGYHAYCPVLPGCHAQGDTLEEAVRGIHEAITLYLESLREHNEPIPQEDLFIHPVEVAMPA